MHFPDGHLRAEEALALEVEFAVGVSGPVAPEARLDRPHALVDLVVADLLHETEDARPE